MKSFNGKQNKRSVLVIRNCCNLRQNRVSFRFLGERGWVDLKQNRALRSSLDRLKPVHSNISKSRTLVPETFPPARPPCSLFEDSSGSKGLSGLQCNRVHAQEAPAWTLLQYSRTLLVEELCCVPGAQVFGHVWKLCYGTVLHWKVFSGNFRPKDSSTRALLSGYTAVLSFRTLGCTKESSKGYIVGICRGIYGELRTCRASVIIGSR